MKSTVTYLPITTRTMLRAADLSGQKLGKRGSQQRMIRLGSGEAVVITKRGKPVAEVVPFKSRTGGYLRGSVRFHDDITGSILDQWDIEK